MSNKYSDAQRKATNKWRSSKSQVVLTIDKEVAERWKAEAKAEGKSLTKWILEKIE